MLNDNNNIIDEYLIDNSLSVNNYVKYYTYIFIKIPNILIYLPL